MIAIRKGNEPEGLVQLRNRAIAAGLSPKASYELLKNPLKEKVRDKLDYYNFVVVCHGNRATRGTHTILDLTCDAHKGNEEFKKINPCIPETMDSITYTLDGKIDANDPDVQYDLVHILNLNCPASPLIAERKSALESLMNDLDNVSDEERSEYCFMVLGELNAETNPKTPYVGILIWYLKSMISALDRQAS